MATRKVWVMKYASAGLVLLSCLFSPLELSATNAPSNLVATGASSSQVNLTWADNSSDETGFTFAFDMNSGLTNPMYDYAGGVNTTSYSHTGLSAASSATSATTGLSSGRPTITSR
jgi:hypothetical protein